MGAALSCRRDGYHADSISRAYYAIMHAARSSLQLYDVTAESHAGVRRMFGQHLVRPGLVEPEWGVAISDLHRNDGRVLKLQDSLETADAAEGAYDRQVEPLPHQDLSGGLLNIAQADGPGPFDNLVRTVHVTQQKLLGAHPA